MLNHVTLMGRLAADPELRTTPQGVAVASFRIAVDRDFKNKQTGERETDWVNIVAWRNTAEFVSRYFAKGRMAVVEGRLQVRPYTDRDGNKRTATEVVAENVYFGDSAPEGSRGGQQSYSGGYGGDQYGGGYSAPPGGGYGTGQYGGQSRGQPQGGYGGQQPGYGGYQQPGPPGGDFAELADDDGDLPF